MGIEQALKDLTVALEANTAALTGGKAAGGTSNKGGSGASAGKVTAETVTAAIGKINTEFGKDAAKAAMVKGGYNGKLADVGGCNPTQLKKLMTALDAAYEALSNGEEEEEDDGGI